MLGQTTQVSIDLLVWPKITSYRKPNEYFDQPNTSSSLKTLLCLMGGNLEESFYIRVYKFEYKIEP